MELNIKRIQLSYLFLLAFTGAGLPLRWDYNLTFERRNLHKLIQTADSAELLPELLNLIGVDEVGGATAEVERVVAGPDIYDVLFLSAAGGEDLVSAAVNLGVIVEFRVDVLLPASPSRLIWGGYGCSYLIREN